jgi:hypothetical protein
MCKFSPSQYAELAPPPPVCSHSGQRPAPAEVVDRAAPAPGWALVRKLWRHTVGSRSAGHSGQGEQERPPGGHTSGRSRGRLRTPRTGRSMPPAARVPAIYSQRILGDLAQPQRGAGAPEPPVPGRPTRAAALHERAVCRPLARAGTAESHPPRSQPWASARTASGCAELPVPGSCAFRAVRRSHAHLLRAGGPNARRTLETLTLHLNIRG